MLERVEGNGRSEDDLAFLRVTTEFRNLLLVEQANGDFGQTLARQFFFDAFNYPFYKSLTKSKDTQLAAIAEKSLKEITYHLRWSSQWIIRLGDGTELSHKKIQTSIDGLWMWTGEMFKPDALDQKMLDEGVGVDLEEVAQQWHLKVDAVFNEAGLKKPEGGWMQQGGKTGAHTEQLGFILAEMQFLQRAYPGQEW